MPEISVNYIQFIRESIEYLRRVPFIHLSFYTGKAYHTPLAIGIMLNTRCNLQCTHCFLDVEHNYKNLMNLDEIYKLIEQIDELGITQVTLTGGEPIMFKGLFDIIRRLKSKGITVGFSTNATLMSDKILKEIDDSGVDRIAISIDGTERVNDSIRGKGTFAKSVKNMDKIISLCRPGRYLDIRINTVVLNANIECLNDLFDMAKIRGIKLNLMPFTVWAGKFVNPDLYDTPDWHKKCWVTPDRIPLLHQTLEHLKKRKRREGVLFNPDNFLDLMKKYYAQPLHANRKCKAGAYYMNIQGNGEVFICDQQIVDVPGNVREKTIKEIWYSDEFLITRKKMAACDKCLLNCMYTPTLWELSKDFIFYPVFRKSGLANLLF